MWIGPTEFIIVARPEIVNNCKCLTVTYPEYHRKLVDFCPRRNRNLQKKDGCAALVARQQALFPLFD